MTALITATTNAEIRTQVAVNKAIHPAVNRYLKANITQAEGAITWESLTDAKRHSAMLKLVLVEWVLERMSRHYTSQNTGIKQLLLALNTNKAPDTVQQAVTELGKTPGKATLAKWIKAYNTQGKLGLANKGLGQVRKLRGWEAKALELYHVPSRPTMNAVARKLREDLGFDEGSNIATDTAVRRFFNSMPSELKDKSSWRMGQKTYRDNQRDYNIRTTENLPVGFIYQGDGHCLDVYLAHPETGTPWRAELTPWMDVRSRYIVGYDISMAESAHSTIASLSKAMLNHDHVPAMLHVDNGSGFKNQLTNDKVAGFYKRFDIDVMWAIPGNAKAKNIERWFRYLEGDFNKMAFPEFFVGDQHSEEAKLYMLRDLNKKTGDKTVVLPTLEEWITEFDLWLTKYHNRPHPEDKSTTPAKMWATLKRTPIHIDYDFNTSMRLQVNVKRNKVRFQNRVYTADFLYQFNDKKMMVEYELGQDKACRLLDLNGRFVLRLQLKSKKDWLPSDRIAEAKIVAAKAATKRLEKQIEEKQARLAPEAINLAPLTELDVLEGECIEMSATAIDEPNDKYADLVSDLANEHLNTLEKEEINLLEEDF